MFCQWLECSVCLHGAANGSLMGIDPRLTSTVLFQSGCVNQFDYYCYQVSNKTISKNVLSVMLNKLLSISYVKKDH